MRCFMIRSVSLNCAHRKGCPKRKNCWSHWKHDTLSENTNCLPRGYWKLRVDHYECVPAHLFLPHLSSALQLESLSTDGRFPHTNEKSHSENQNSSSADTCTQNKALSHWNFKDNYLVVFLDSYDSTCWSDKEQEELVWSYEDMKIEHLCGQECK